MIRCIAAIDNKRGVATSTGIPWHLPGDAAYFRDQTRHGLIVMGGATYVEFAQPLHQRTNFVLTTRPDALREGFEPIASLDQLRSEQPGEEIWVIGGAGVFATTIARADELYLTQVLDDFHCTKFFPAYRDQFTRFDEGDTHEEGGVSYRFEKWRRTGAVLPPS
jgi:dihydrofolate reductase